MSQHKSQRNRAIYEANALGERVASIARRYGLSHHRTTQIIQDEQRRSRECARATLTTLQYLFSRPHLDRFLQHTQTEGAKS